LCLAVYAKIEKVDGASAEASVHGNRVRINLMLVPEARVGDYVLLHAGFAIAVVDEADVFAEL